MEVKPKKQHRYRNRDIDWLSFNHRVLQEAQDENNPLYERLKFLAIFSSNLDEFFKVRVSRLRQIKKVDKKLRKNLALRPNKTLKHILGVIDGQQELFGKIFNTGILPKLANLGIVLKGEEDFDSHQRDFATSFFKEQVLPKLTYTTSIDLDRLFFEDGQLYLTVTFQQTEDLAFVSVPVSKCSRFIQIPSTEGDYQYTFLEDVIRVGLVDLFPDETKIDASYAIKISRDAELYLEDTFDGELVQQIQESLSRRQLGQPTRLLYDKRMPKELRKNLRKLLGLGKVDLIKGGSRHNFSDFFGFPAPVDDSTLYYEPFPALKHRDFEQQKDVFELLREKDRILHFPYQTFDYLSNWISNAAADSRVKRIKISLYRIAKDSKLGNALLKALKNGIKVTIFVEAKARFDEENNLKWGREFEKHGAHVHYSFPDIKVHSKILMMQREEQGKLVNYAYIGTGNFNDKTAKLYCDHGLFTAHERITSDLQNVFTFLEGSDVKPEIKDLIVSPFHTRSRFENLIDTEIKNARIGLPASITIKMNSLEDKLMINKLYEANEAGVKIRLLIRGFCCLIPEKEGLSEHIQVTSIVDRFLEHGRLYLFHNNGDEKLYMGSADWMTRNIEKRVEVLAPILDRDIFRELKDILELQLEDNVKSRVIGLESNNLFKMPIKGEVKVRSQYAIYEYLKDIQG